jgi:hypothetical protein
MASPPRVSEPPPPASNTIVDSALDNDPDIDMAGAAPDAPVPPQVDGANDPDAEGGEVRQEALDLNLEEARLPLRKDVSLREFLSKMDDFAPVVSLFRATP